MNTIEQLYSQLRALITRHRFPIAILLTIVIALIMTVISLSLYATSGTLQLDLSRPGYETARKELIQPSQNTDYATTGPINKQALDDYQQRFDKQRTELNEIGKFKDRGLDDESLMLSQDTAQQ